MPSQTSVAERETAHTQQSSAAEHTQQSSGTEQETEQPQQASGTTQRAEQSQPTSEVEDKAGRIERRKIITRSVIGGLSTVAIILLIAIIVLGAQATSTQPHFV